MKNLITLFSLLFVMVSCNLEPKKINFGEDSCYYCSMTIVDRQHAAQLITKKGKVYNFDAAECMINALSDFEEAEIGRYLVTDYETPEKLIDATSATFIVSPEIPSPMRANLAALASQANAVSLQQSKSGELYSWEEIQLLLNN
ncbi:MAG: hypothetical protein HKO54_09765 [Flavobacteriaceae bacterium]|nr:hypothetical protein [Flavobacteriaceae bacterium]